MNTKLLLMAFVTTTLMGCASSSGIVPMGPDTYTVARQAGSGFAGMGGLKQEAIQEANEFCSGHGKQLQVLATHDAQPPYILGNFPRSEVEFTCLSESDAKSSKHRKGPRPASN